MKNSLLIGFVIIAGFVFYSLYSPGVCLGRGCGVTSGIEQTASLSSPAIVQRQLSADQFILIDVREDEEWAAGHIAGAKHVSLSRLNSETTKDFPKDKQIYLYCRSGKRAEDAELIMKDLGFERAMSIGGVTEWQKNGGILVQ